MKVLVCYEWDSVTETCTGQAFVDWPGVIPPLPAAQGMQLSGLMIVLVMSAWGYKFLRRFLAPRFG